MYTNGIRKIFTTINATNTAEAFKQAEQAGYGILNWTGQIYAADLTQKSSWIKTVLTIDDFETN